MASVLAKERRPWRRGYVGITALAGALRSEEVCLSLRLCASVVSFVSTLPQALSQKERGSGIASPLCVSVPLWLVERTG